MTWYKRAFDLLLASILAIVLAPVFVGLIIWLWWVQGWPMFYVSERMRSPDRAFQLVKFRTMTRAQVDSGVSGGDKSDRITPAGKWLRARRFDELPQLWNVFKGDLSFVGPRPPLRLYVERYPDVYARVLRSRPGITGLATLVYHRHEERLLSRCRTPAQTDAVYARACIPRKARLDLLYQRHCSLCFDTALMLKTIRRVVAR
ncbi:sugar transferase [Rhodophyticola porphyridii]|uniref:Sugar transferase n=1 Tax=Rhodophyticola porphyridii TaxID=1852017 RepID=A0A3L9Y5H7_9RHOB|nr:sugar transferase [Rhodophyticola porphyridii]RMA42725.1 sugar transferase [Rhodophyticola porphyridii]